MNNLEFMHIYERLRSAGFSELTEDQIKLFMELGSIGISQLTDEQILSMQGAMNKMIEIFRIGMQTMDHELRSRGIDVKKKQVENDKGYITPAEIQLDNMEKKLSRKGETAERIAIAKSVAIDLANSINFDDLLK